MKRIGVFCGSNVGLMPDYSEDAVTLAEVCAKRGIGIVYGGGGVGLMGVLRMWRLTGVVK